MTPKIGSGHRSPTRASKKALAEARANAEIQLHGAAASACPLRVTGRALSGAEPHGVPGPLPVADPVAVELEAALALRRTGADPKALRRALRRIEELLDE